MLKQPSPEYALDMLWRVADHCVRDLGWFAELLPARRVRREHVREQAWRPWATAIREALDAGRFVAARSCAAGRRRRSRCARRHDWATDSGPTRGR
jgi:hypothetical protein